MKISAPNVILFIEPTTPASEEPLIDDLTKKIIHAMRNAVEKDLVVTGSVESNGLATISHGVRTLGYHYCICGRHSEGADYGIKFGADEVLFTNSLAPHYVAYHRECVSEEELKLIGMLDDPPNPFPCIQDWELGHVSSTRQTITDASKIFAKLKAERQMNQNNLRRNPPRACKKSTA